jgi:RND family efflux transporter MFP subunit
MLAAANADLEAAELALERTVIRAPYDGRVRRKKADVGQYVVRGQPVAAIYAVDYAEVRLPLGDEQLAQLDLPLGFTAGRDADDGPEVVLSARYAGGEHEWKGRIVRTEGVVDPRSRMVYAVARVKDPYSVGDGSRPPLATGLFVSASVEGREIDGVGVVPRSALYGGNRIAVVDAEEKLSFRSVKVVRADGDDVVVRGLRDGERVCLSTLDFASDGTKVRVADELSPRVALVDGPKK